MFIGRKHELTARLQRALPRSEEISEGFLMKHVSRNLLICLLTCIFLCPSSVFAASALQKGATELGGLAAIFAVLHERETHYYRYADPAGPIEKHFTPLGAFDVAEMKLPAAAPSKSITIFYPRKLPHEPLPLVLFANGTGTPVSKYPEVLRHLASWGFIAVGNEDGNVRTGASMEQTLDAVLAEAGREGSPLYGHVDSWNIGIAGHSQGGVGAINAVTQQPSGSRYRAIYAASATSSFWGQDGKLGADWRYDLSRLSIPIFFVAGTGAWDAGTATGREATSGQGIAPLWSLHENYAATPASTPKIIARRKDKDHGDMLRAGDAYMTAWFSYWLQGDAEAGTAFFGKAPELAHNKHWQDVEISIPSENLQIYP